MLQVPTRCAPYESAGPAEIAGSLKLSRQRKEQVQRDFGGPGENVQQIHNPGLKCAVARHEMTARTILSAGTGVRSRTGQIATARFRVGVAGGLFLAASARRSDGTEGRMNDPMISATALVQLAAACAALGAKRYAEAYRLIAKRLREVASEKEKERVDDLVN